jgi:hypothetical protein
MTTPRSPLRVALSLSVVAVVVAACAAASGPSAIPSPSTSTSPPPAAAPASPVPKPTPIAVDVASPADAAALVIATDPRFEGAIALTPDIIGASKWWEATAVAGGGYHVTITIGWGDCPAGCINEHVWDFEVSADGQVTLIGESGDPISSGGIPGDS